MGSLHADDRPHSAMGPSSFDRAEKCPASTMNEGRVDGASAYAREGTAAHALFEVALKTGEETYTWEGTPVFDDAGEHILDIDMAMIEAVDPMVEATRRIFKPGFELEPRLEMPKSRMYGYADVLGFSEKDGLLTIADLKYGSQFVGADATQLGLYAVMACFKYRTGIMGADDTAPAARTVILQPRAGDKAVRSHIWTAGDLRSLMKRVTVVDHLLDTAGNSLPYKAGKHCGWCGRAALCPKLRQMVQDVAMATIISDPSIEFEVEELEEAAHMLPAVELWAKKTRGMISDYIMAGGNMQQAKAVLGRGSRIWAEPELAEELATKYGIDPYEEPKLLSPAKMEKAMPRLAQSELKQFVEIVPGRPRMALVDDPGKPIKIMQGLENANLAQMANKLVDPKFGK